MIYTKTGDKGQTSLANGQRVAKTDPRIEAYGTVDELNSWIGLLRSGVQSTEDRVQTELAWIQNKLFNLGAELSEAPGEWITDADVHQLETWIDAMQAEVPKQHAFVLPAGSESVTRCHVCRTVCRRAERRMKRRLARSNAYKLAEQNGREQMTALMQAFGFRTTIVVFKK